MDEIKAWMANVQGLPCSTSFTHRLKSKEVDPIVEHFKAMLDKGLSINEMSKMTKAIRLLLSIMKDSTSSWVGVVDIFQRLLSTLTAFTHIQNHSELQRLNDEIIDLVTDSLEEEETKTLVLEGLARHMLVGIVNVNSLMWMRISWLKAFNIMLAGARYGLKELLMADNPEEFEQLVEFLQSCGDYDTQSSIVEALLRFATKTNRSSLATVWFPINAHTRDLFVKIKYKNFETGCRNFLSGYNESLGNSQKVFSIPAIGCQLNGKQLFKPPDEDYTDFWVDFNLVPSTVSLYYVKREASTDLWDLLTISQDMVTALSTSSSEGNFIITINFNKADTKTLWAELVFPQTQSLPRLLHLVFPGKAAPVPSEPVCTHQTPGRACLPTKILLPKSPHTKYVSTTSAAPSLEVHPLSPEVTSSFDISLPCGQQLNGEKRSRESQDNGFLDQGLGLESLEVDKVIPETQDVNDESCAVSQTGQMKVNCLSEEESQIIPSSLPSFAKSKPRKGWKKMKSKLGLKKSQGHTFPCTSASAIPSSELIASSTTKGTSSQDRGGFTVKSALGDSSPNATKIPSFHSDSKGSLLVGEDGHHHQVALNENGSSPAVPSCGSISSGDGDSLPDLAKVLAKRQKLLFQRKRSKLRISPKLSQVRESQEYKEVIEQPSTIKPSSFGIVHSNQYDANTSLEKITSCQDDKFYTKKSGGLRCVRKAFKPWLDTKSRKKQGNGKGRKSLVRKTSEKNTRSEKLFSDDDDEGVSSLGKSPFHNPFVSCAPSNTVDKTSSKRRMVGDVQNTMGENGNKSYLTIQSQGESSIGELDDGILLDGLASQGKRQEDDTEVLLIWALNVLEMVSSNQDVNPDLKEMWSQIKNLAEAHE